MKTLRDLLDVAIQQEINSQDLYRKGLKVIKDPESQKFLKELVKEEEEHEKMLYNIKETGLYDLDVVVKDDSIFKSGESSHDVQDEAFKEDWTMEEILNLALKREYRANQIFVAASKTARDTELITLLKNLAEEEINHHKNIEKKYKIQTGSFGPEI
ncbi:MAG: ferritin family protein [Calditrichaceae bacterium]